MKFKEKFFTPRTISSIALLLSLIANLFVIFGGALFYRSTFRVGADKIDICSGTDYQTNFALVAIVSLVIALPAGISAIVFSIMNKARRQAIIALIAVVLSISPYPIGQFINDQIITHCASAFTEDGCK